MKKVMMLVLSGLCSLWMAAAAAQDWFYTVRPGDNVWNISHELLKDWRYWKDILKRNRIQDAAVLKPGMRIAIPLYVVRELPAQARVDAVHGKVEVIYGSDGRRVPLKPGMRLASRDKVITGDKSVAWLSLADDSSLLLQANSELEFTQLRRLGSKRVQSMEARIRVNRGEVKMDANPGKNPDSLYEISTVASSSAVRGTGFRIGVDGASTRTEVLQGQVNVFNDLGEVDVPEGYGTRVVKNEPPKPPKTLLPAPDLSEFPDRIRYLPKVVDFSSSLSAPRFRVEIAVDQKFLQPVLDRVVRDRLMIDRKLADGDYYVRVRGIDELGLEGHDGVVRLRIEARPEPPLVTGPQPGQVLHAGAVEFSWAAVQGVESYLFELSRNASFDSIEMNRKTTDTHLKIPIAEPGEYYFRITSVDETGHVGPPGKPHRLDILPIPSIPESKPPKLDDKWLKLSWAPVEGIAQYQVQLARDETFDELVFDQVVDQAWVELPRPIPEYYYFRLRAIDAEGFKGDFSPPQGFRVQPTSYVPLILMGLGVLLLVL